MAGFPVPSALTQVGADLGSSNVALSTVAASLFASPPTLAVGTWLVFVTLMANAMSAAGVRVSVALAAGIGTAVWTPLLPTGEAGARVTAPAAAGNDGLSLSFCDPIKVTTAGTVQVQAITNTGTATALAQDATSITTAQVTAMVCVKIA